MACEEAPGIFEAALALLRGGTPVWIPSAGLSMGSAFSGVGSVLVRKANPDGICPGMIMVYARDGAWVAHRVIRVIGAGPNRRFRMKGDGAAVFDIPDVEVSECVGEVVGLERDGIRRMFGPGERAFRRVKAMISILKAWFSTC